LCAWSAGPVVAEIGRRSGQPLQFLQIGSNDGLANDPLQATVRAWHWSGVLVEPIPALFSRLVANYAGVSGLAFCNVAIGNETGTTTMYTVARQPGDPGWVEQLASLSRDVVSRHAYALPDLERRIVPVEVECLGLAELVARGDLHRVDLLHIDAEGFDDTIIRQIPMNAAWAPQYLLFETKHMDRDCSLDTRARLKRAGYRVIDMFPDALAYRSWPGRDRRQSSGGPPG
jgi:FkbM family methyltransferase